MLTSWRVKRVTNICPLEKGILPSIQEFQKVDSISNLSALFVHREPQIESNNDQLPATKTFLVKDSGEA